MSEQISKELLKVMNEITDNENAYSKIDASIFIRNSEKIINEKIAYLYNIINIEAKNCFQSQSSNFDEVNLIITHYKQKLNMVYDEFYCQYVNIQNELQEATANRKIAMINYQKIVNKYENNSPTKDDLEIKEEIKNKNEIYKKIINKCNLKFDELKNKFEKTINDEFFITSKSLQLVSEQNIFQRIFGKLENIFSGGKKYKEILKQYNKSINEIDSYEIAQQMKNDTIEFVADILEMRGINENGLEENVRIGGKNGKNK